MEILYAPDSIAAKIISSGKGISQEESTELSAVAPTEVLLEAAGKVTAGCVSRKFDTCSIINAKSGRCPEDCKWCAQSAHYETGASVYPLKPEEDMIKAAETSWRHGIGRFSFVTSGRRLSDNEVDIICRTAEKIRAVCGISLCMSAGLLSGSQLERLASAGISRYHCNLESAPSFFGSLCSTHTQKDKIETLAAAKSAGMDICSGGIIGMGETELQRIELAFTLRDLGVSSVPVNVLCPIPGTPLAGMPPLSDEDVLRSVAFFRLILPDASLRFAGGITRFSKETVEKAYRTGINSAILGDMLTTSGTDIAENFSRIRNAGYEL